MTDRATFEARASQFIDALSEWSKAHYAKTYEHVQAPTYSLERGPKYIRIVSDYRTQRSVYGFLDYNGNIYKADGWKKPAKHIRGSIFDEDFSLGRACQPHGIAYLK